MARTLVFPIRLTQQERDKLESYAQQQGVSSAEVIRDYIKSLPSLPVQGDIESRKSRLEGSVYSDADTYVYSAGLTAPQTPQKLKSH